MNILYLIGRIIVGLYFITHGYAHIKHKAAMIGYAQSRGMKMAPNMVLVSGIGIMLAGAGLIVGIFPEVALIGMMVFLIAVSVMVHNFWKDTDPAKRSQERTSFEGNIALAAALLMVLSFVSGWVL